MSVCSFLRNPFYASRHDIASVKVHVLVSHPIGVLNSNSGFFHSRDHHSLSVHQLVASTAVACRVGIFIIIIMFSILTVISATDFPVVVLLPENTKTSENLLQQKISFNAYYRISSDIISISHSLRTYIHYSCSVELWIFMCTHWQFIHLFTLFMTQRYLAQMTVLL